MSNRRLHPSLHRLMETQPTHAALERLSASKHARLRLQRFVAIDAYIEMFSEDSDTDSAAAERGKYAAQILGGSGHYQYDLPMVCTLPMRKNYTEFQ